MVHPLEILWLGPPLIKRQQRRVFQRKQGKPGHQRIRQTDFNIQRTMFGYLTEEPVQLLE